MPAQAVSITSSDKSLTLEIYPETGGCISRFELEKDGKKVPLLRPYNPALELSPLNFGNFPLTPFSNRIGFCKLAFQGKAYHVGPPRHGEAHTNHGDGWMSPWTVTEHTDTKLRLELETTATAEMPYSYKAFQTFEFIDNVLHAEIGVENTGGEPMPFGFGHHPYFPRTDKTTLEFEAENIWLSKQMVPVENIPVPEKWDFSTAKGFDPQALGTGHGGDGSAHIDHCYGGFKGRARITWPETDTTLTFEADPIFKHFVLYVPSNNNFFCAEPVTNATDGFNLADKGVKDTGMISLSPGQSASGKVAFTIT